MSALEGLPGVSKVEMDLARDLFTVRAEKARPHDFAMIQAIRRLGFVPMIMGDFVPRASATDQQAARGAPPAIVVAALQQAAAQNKLLLVDFHASWCGPCKRMLKETWRSPLLADVMARVVFLKVDTDAHPAAAQFFKVSGLPDVRLLDRHGNELLKLRGFKDANAAGALLRPLTRSKLRAPPGNTRP